jgi:8-amino-7-oxononanoate synthase
MSHPQMDKIHQHMATQEAKGLLRRRHVVDALACPLLPCALTQVEVDFSHNDYLGLATEPKLADALHQGALLYGVGSKASPLVSGYSQAHLALEQKLCQLTGHESAMLFCSGFSANSALMTGLLGQGDVIIADKLVHASVIDGIQASQGKLVRFIHNDIISVETKMAQYPNSLVVTESVFSMDGDLAPIAELSRLAKMYNQWLIVDDAHGFAVLPQGTVTSDLADIQLVTFGKALGCQGAAILASKAVIDYLVATSRHYIYSTALSPASAHLALAAIECIEAEPQRVSQLNANIGLFRTLAKSRGLGLMDSKTAIQGIIIGDNAQTMSAAAKMAALGFKLGAIRSPTVPVGKERLRITINTRHTAEQIAGLVDALAKVCAGQ